MNKTWQEQSLELSMHAEHIKVIVTLTKSLKKQMDVLQESVEDMEQYSCSNTVEIHSILKDSNENLIETTKLVQKNLEVEINESNTDVRHRIRKLKEAVPP